MNRWLFIALFVVAVGGAAAVYFSMSSGLPVQTAQVTRGPIREFVDERGKTRLPEDHLITMPFAGRVESIGLIEGETVTAGQIVARISATDIEEEVAEARAAVARLDASLVENDDATVEKSTREQAELFAESMTSTVAAAEARQIAGKRRLDYSEIFLGRTRKLAETGAETQDDLDRAELAYVESQIDYRTDVLTVESLKAMQAATNLLPRIVTEQISKKSLSAAVIRQQKQEAEARLRQALTRKARSEMKSPVDGVILERAITNEQYLTAGTTLLRIGQLEQLEIEADVLSEDVVQIRPHDPVEIYGPAVGATVGRGVAGMVHRIHPSGFMKISSLGVEQQRVTIIVRFAEGVLGQLRAERELGVDYRVRVRVFTDERADTLLVPRSAIFRSAENGWEVFVVRGNRAEKQAVEVGLMNDEAVEIISGLSAGDAVILAPESNLEAGTRVSIRYLSVDLAPVQFVRQYAFLYRDSRGQPGRFAHRNGIAGNAIARMSNEVAANAATGHEQSIHVGGNQSGIRDVVRLDAALLEFSIDLFIPLSIQGVNVDRESRLADSLFMFEAICEVFRRDREAASNAAALSDANLFGSGDDGNLLPRPPESAHPLDDVVDLSTGANGRLGDGTGIKGRYPVLMIRHQRIDAAVQVPQCRSTIGRFDAVALQQLEQFSLGLRTSLADKGLNRVRIDAG